MNRTDYEMICRDPESFSVREVRDAGYWLLANIDTALSDKECGEALNACLYVREVR
jgi:hypothetical protein